MRRVAITGMGIVSCLGNSLAAVAQALRESRSGIREVEEYRSLGLDSQVAGIPDVSSEAPVDRKMRRFMGDAAHYAYLAMSQAVRDAGFGPDSVSHPRTGLIVGSGVGSPLHHIHAADTLRERGFSKVLPYEVPRVMGSTASACLSTAFGVQGVSYSMTSACATSSHCIGHAAELIQFGKQDLMFAGGAEEVTWPCTLLFDAMRALSTRYNHTPQSASRPYDAERDGFVIAGGAGVLVLEEWNRAVARGAHIYGELAGYGASSDGRDMVTPDIDGAARAMRLALAQAGGTVDYLNTHGTSTPAGDLNELEAVRRVFGAEMPPMSSTKGLTGHPIGASGVHEAIYCLLMMQEGFIAPCTNIERLDPAAAEFPLVRHIQAAGLRTAMSNSFGFGGTNACLVFRRAE